MCKEADDQVPEKKVANPNAPPEPAEPTPIPQDAMETPEHKTNFDHTAPTIANAETFSDKDLSSTVSV
ncbi:hypothetical protein TVAG_370040 [Trichomonas vaginalis G3]|uniref:Uncharacterized protein n=1 Tax=Trichomonas vaginalis (strain ATCC PRA-98 / G3) TaxID=412133 RepID=A2EX56_TRIV3|nr:hypothetical protein TVAGG3_0860120 [Trichomonas vaginalis G3]EAY02776.1 hypothetical protein TVAG_370040 [Trichomonas vaginalis G3]KAI5500610.1 hypothetical protein TVAGG3_0860120 [Trichomonas vaginalis G3]|eukprot:XP_001314999.1 hypothetical protein [Trichomonas vaginalis G3]